MSGHSTPPGASSTTSGRASGGASPARLDRIELEPPVLAVGREQHGAPVRRPRRCDVAPARGDHPFSAVGGSDLDDDRQRAGALADGRDHRAVRRPPRRRVLTALGSGRAFGLARQGRRAIGRPADAPHCEPLLAVARPDGDQPRARPHRRPGPSAVRRETGAARAPTRGRARRDPRRSHGPVELELVVVQPSAVARQALPVDTATSTCAARPPARSTILMSGNRCGPCELKYTASDSAPAGVRRRTMRGPLTANPSCVRRVTRPRRGAGVRTARTKSSAHRSPAGCPAPSGTRDRRGTECAGPSPSTDRPAPVEE